jgi:hypothetical protein
MVATSDSVVMGTVTRTEVGRVIPEDEIEYVLMHTTLDVDKVLYGDDPGRSVVFEETDGLWPVSIIGDQGVFFLRRTSPDYDGPAWVPVSSLGRILFYKGGCFFSHDENQWVKEIEAGTPDEVLALIEGASENAANGSVDPAQPLFGG